MALGIIKWSWVLGALHADPYDSIRDAVLAAKWAADNGDEALHCIEIIESDGSRILTTEEYRAIVDPIRKEESEAIRNRPKDVAVIRLASPDGKNWAHYEGFTDKAKAQAVAARYSEMLGSSRVKLEPAR